LLRGQGTYLTDDEIESVTESVSTGEQNFVHELLHIKVQKPEGDEGSGSLPNRDDLYESAVDVVIREGRGSVSLLQRALGIGYGRAARLIDFMEQDGIVGAYNGSKSREVIMTLDQWQTMQSGSGERGDDSLVATIPVVQSSPPGRVTKLAASRAISPSAAKPKLAALDRSYDDDEEATDDEDEDDSTDAARIDEADALYCDDTEYDSDEEIDESDEEDEDR
jgi:S-DNA-T family DNA segregation ATPase FtsK/SpoIIIE